MGRPRYNEPVDRPCDFCGREPNAGERYGTEPGTWDFTNICPECWDDTTAEPDDGAPDADTEAF